MARAAGVSQSTVSIVLAGKAEGRVKPETRQAVHEAARRLGYRPNLAARNLRLGRTRTLLLVVPTLTGPVFGAIYAGAAEVAAARGFGVVLHPWPDDAGPARSQVDTQAIEGVLASSIPGGVTDFGDLPLVMMDSDPAEPTPAASSSMDGRPPEPPPPVVNFDVAGGMRQIAAHLTELGHRRIGHLAAAVDAWTFRVRGEALAASVPGPLVRRTTAIDVAAAREAALELLDRPDRPSAVVCDDDLIAAGAYKAARALGLDVPGDLSVTGFDDVLLATALEPELTTIRLPAERLGATAMTALLELLDGHRPTGTSLPGELVVRASTAPPA